MNPKVSVIIATYNRFDSLLKAIESVKAQTYKNIELIVVNDASTDERYYSLSGDGYKIIHLEQNTREQFGFPCSGYVRKIGIENSTGEYIAILDDDDLFFDIKISAQIYEMLSKGMKMCCSDALAGKGMFSYATRYHSYLHGLNLGSIQQSLHKNELPAVVGKEVIKDINFILHSSIVFERKLYDRVGGYRNLPNGEEDYSLWLEMLTHENCLFIKTPLLYYDARINVSFIYKVFAILKSKFFK